MISSKELKTIHKPQLKSKILYLIVLLLATLGTRITAYGQEVFLPHYTTKNGLPSNNCYYTLQDKSGFLWIATDAGVSRFDGAVFENFSVDDGLPDNQVLQIREDSKGRIWFMALNGQLSYFYNGKIENEKNNILLKELNLNGVVVSFLEDSKGDLWFATNNNMIASWNGQTVKKITPKNGIKLQNSFLFENEVGKVAAINNFGNYIYNNGTFVNNNTTTTTISYKTAQKRGTSLYFLNENGLNQWQQGIPKPILTIKSNHMSNLGYIHLANEDFWISTNKGAIRFFDNGKTKVYLENASINQIITDRSGNTWFTTSNGIYKLPHPSEQLLKFRPSDARKGSFESIAMDDIGRLWLGDKAGSITILDLKTHKMVNLELGNKSIFNTVKQIKLDVTNGKIYFASDYGLGVVSSNYPASKTINYLKETNDKFFVIKNFSIDRGNKLALSMSSGVAIITDRSQLEFSSLKFKEREDFFKDRSYRVYYDDHQQLWFSNTSGLAEFKQGKLNQHFQKYPILKKRINDMCTLSDGSIALATDGYGIVHFKNDKILKVIDHRKGLSSNIVHKLFAKNADLWAITNTGINKIIFNGDSYSINAYDDINGLLSSEINDLYIDKDIAYFATNNGLIYFNYTLSKQNNTAPQVHITSIINSGKALPLNRRSHTFSTKDQNITINYSAIDFANRNITYRYRLKKGAAWIETKNRRIEFSNLEPGEYTLEISAKSQNSNWSAASKVDLKLARNFYQKWWFILLSALVIGYLIYFIGVKITKKQKDKEQEQLLLRNKILMLEQQALQAMMNPHFVFNVMNSIQHYINTQNTSSANKVLTGFARLIRKNLEICTQSYISLDEEINYLNLYLNLEKNRFGDKFRFELNVGKDIDTEETMLPSMLLQPFIENAIWHGIMPQENGGAVIVNIEKESNRVLKIVITDDGVGIDNTLASKKNAHQSKGMALTKERIALLNQIEAKAIQLLVKQNGKKGTIVALTLPMKE